MMRLNGNRTAGYMRLSREDGDKLESDSIKNQRDLIMSYIAQNKDLVFEKEYVDDGYSGTNYERPSFRFGRDRACCGRLFPAPLFGSERKRSNRFIRPKTLKKPCGSSAPVPMGKSSRWMKVCPSALPMPAIFWAPPRSNASFRSRVSR